MKSKNNYFIKGLEHAEGGNYSAAIDCFTRALETEENPHIYYERALACFHIMDNQSALADMNKAQELDPENPYRYSSRAYIKDRSGDTEGAIEDYKKAIELDPEDAISHNNLGLLEEKAGFSEMAGNRFKMADGLAANSGFFNDLPEQEKMNYNGNGRNLPSGFSHSIESGKKNFRPGQYLREIYYVFTKKSVWLEFLRFIKKGGKF